MPAFPQEWMDELRSRNDIVGVVSEYLPLSPRGGRYWGLCPFHGEKTASFSVSADKQLYYCFGCHVGGDVVHFVKSMEKLPYIDAIRHLASRVNLDLPNTIDDAKLQREREKRERFYRANQEAARWYHQKLKERDGQRALQYLQARGITAPTAIAFGLGSTAAQGDELARHLLQRGFASQELQQIGLIRQNNGRNYDAFRQRLMFPIVAGNRQVMGFGGRVLGEGQPKYLNSPESLIFNKRRQLYGANMLKGRTLSSLILVEGYMDVIRLYQAGIEATVATLGTALTQAQARLIKRYAPRVYLAYDGDAAGQSATLKGLEILEKEDLEVFVIPLPRGMDPDDFVRSQGKDAFLQRQKKALSLHGFQLHHLRSQYDLKQQEPRETYAREAAALIQRFSPIEQERYYYQLSQETRFSVDALRKEGDIQASQPSAAAPPLRRQGQPPAQYDGISSRRLQLERMIVVNAMEQAEAIALALPFAEAFKLPAHRWAWSVLKETPQTSIPQLLSAASEEDAAVLAASVSVARAKDPLLAVQVALLDLRKEHHLEQIEQLQQKADDTQTDIDRRKDCIQQIRVLHLLNEELEAEKSHLS